MWEKGEIAHYEQFLLFPQCFQKACFPGASKGVVWEWVEHLLNKTVFPSVKFMKMHLEQFHSEPTICFLGQWR